jgi:hypothetical protein
MAVFAGCAAAIEVLTPRNAIFKYVTLCH